MSNPESTSVGIIAACFLGYMLARGLELAHALMHGSFFTERFWRANRILGVVLTAPFLLPWSQWRWTHFHHHRDPRIEGFDYPDVRTIVDLPKLIGHHIMWPHWFNSLKRTAFTLVNIDKLRFELNEMVHNTAKISQKGFERIVLEYRFNIAANLSWFSALFIIDGAVLLLYVAALVFGSVFHVLIEFPEHVLANLDDKNPESNSFEITNCRLCDVLSYNNSRHATHHRHPEVPIYYLPILSNQLEHAEASSSYVQFWSRFIRERIVQFVKPT
jgi:fatty acid desaturase